MKKIIMLIFSAMFLSFSCATTSSSTKDSSTFNMKKIMGKEFVLENMYKDLSITIGFEADRVFGFGGINRYFGPYKLDGDKIEFKNLATTMMAGHPKDMEAEKNYLDMLAKATNISLDKNTLTLKLSTGKELVFIKK